MWDIQIGESVNRICTAHDLWKFSDDFIYEISSNSESYWVSESFLNVGMTVFKGTIEYDQLQQLLKHPDTNSIEISNWIKATLLRHVNPCIVTSALQKRYQDGYADAKRDFRKQARTLLGID